MVCDDKENVAIGDYLYEVYNTLIEENLKEDVSTNEEIMEEIQRAKPEEENLRQVLRKNLEQMKKKKEMNL